MPLEPDPDARLGSLCSAWPSIAPAQPRRPVYVGAKVCATCHDGKNAGQQTTRWLALEARPRLRQPGRAGGPRDRRDQRRAHRTAEVAALPGLPCHGSQRGSWEKDDTFSIRDGVQCEKCHGPGSEHVRLVACRQRANAGPKVRLPSPLGADCMKCHKDKPSHTRSSPNRPTGPIGRPRRSSLPRPCARWLIPRPEAEARGERAAAPARSMPRSSAKYTGSQACAACHDAAGEGLPVQPLAGHEACAGLCLARLARPASRSRRRRASRAIPQSSAACLKCHATAYHRPAAGAAESYSVLEGVGCESCHGAGSALLARSRDEGPVAVAPGRTSARSTSRPASSCHEQAHGKPFDYDAALEGGRPPGDGPAARDCRSGTRRRSTWPSGPGTRELYVTCEASSTVCVIDTAANRKVAEIPVGGQPTDVTFSPDGRRAYVTNRLDDSLSRRRHGGPPGRSPRSPSATSRTAFAPTARARRSTSSTRRPTTSR